MNVGKPVGNNEEYVCYFEVDAVFNREPVELLEESTWTAGLTKRDNGIKSNCTVETGMSATRRHARPHAAANTQMAPAGSCCMATLSPCQRVAEIKAAAAGCGLLQLVSAFYHT